MNKETIHLIKGYLGYEVPVQAIDSYSLKCFKSLTLDDYLIIDKLDLLDDLEQGLIKLKLRPIEDLTDVEIKQLWYEMPVYVDNANYNRNRTLSHLLDDIQSLDYKTMEYLSSIHIDYFGLIGQGLAIKKGN